MGCRFSKISIPQCEAEACRLVSELQSSSLISRLPSSVQELKEFLLNNQNPLTYLYLNNAIATKKLLASFKLRISGARVKLAIILLDLECNQNPDQKSYSSQTLERLREFMGTGEPSARLLADDEFSSLCQHLQSTVKQLNSKKDEIERKMSSTKKLKKVWIVLHNSVFISVLTLSVILAAMSAPPLATVAATASSTAIKTAEQWIDSMWAERLDALKNEKDAILMMIKGNNVFGVHKLESIRAMSERLEEELALKMAMNNIRPKVEEIGKWIDEVEMKVNACDDEIGKLVADFLNTSISD